MAVIGIDAASLSVSGKGVSRYQHNLIKSLAALDRLNSYYVFFNKRNILPELPRQDNFHYAGIDIPNHIVWDQFLLPGILKRYKPDIYHTTSDSLPFFARAKIALYIFEIPDYRINLMSACVNNSLYSRISYKYNQFFFPRSLMKAEIIMVSSQSTKADLMRRYGVKEEKTAVVYPGTSECFRPCIGEEAIINIRRRYGVENGYVLHISSTDPRDNTPAVVRAFAKAVKEAGIGQRLIIAGNVESGLSGLSALIAELDLRERVIFAGYFSQEHSAELAALYQAADLYVDPSLYEGFGFQVAEALACGTPVVSSNVTSLPEIVGNAGIMVSPEDVEALAKGMMSVLTDKQMRQSMRYKGIKQAKLFSWKENASLTLKIYNKICGLKLPS